MRIAFTGCGYVASFYAATLSNHPELELAGVFDRNEERANRFALSFNVYQYASLREILEDKSISIVVNLTSIKAHYAITKSCLEAGKHVYSEKPLSTNLEEARSLLDLAREKSLQISCAPANLLSESAQTVWKLLRHNTIGKVWLAYAELDDGAIHQSTYRNWQSRSGVSWPFEEEFEMGCTLEHAGYYLGWLTAFFGPARQINSFSSCLIPDKLAENSGIQLGNDLSVSCITFSSGVVARLTCSIVAPMNRSLTIIGSEGVITVEDCWKFESPVYLQKRLKNAEGISRIPSLTEKSLVELEKPEKNAELKHKKARHTMDFARGIAELADAIQNQRISRLSAQHALHITEILLSITASPNSRSEIESSFPPMIPMPWVKEDENCN